MTYVYCTYVVGNEKSYLSHLTPSVGVIPAEYVNESYTVKNETQWLSVSENGIILRSLLLTQYRRTNGQTDRQRDVQTDRIVVANAYFTPPTRTRLSCLVRVGGVNWSGDKSTHIPTRH